MSDYKDILSTEDCSTILKNYTNRNDCEVSSFTIKPFSEIKEGLIGEHFIVNIDYEDKSERFFMKILNGSSKVLFDLCMSLNAYEKEEFFYKILHEEFAKYNIDVSFAPKAFLCRPFLIVLEDLSTKHFKPIAKHNKTNLDLAHCKSSLKTLAKFHAASLILEELKTKQSGCDYSLKTSYPEHFEDKLFSGEENAASKWLKHSMEGIFKLIECIPQNHITKEQYQNKLGAVLEELVSEENGRKEKIKSCALHGDLWSNNFLFFYKEGLPIDSKLIDFQLLKYGSPSADVMQFIYTNTRKEFRTKHITELVEHYHECCCEFLEKSGIDVAKLMPKDEFLSSCEDHKIASKIQTIADRSITFLSDDTYKEACSSDEALRKFIFEERSSNIVHSFETCPEFRELITEDMLELRDMLFQ